MGAVERGLAMETRRVCGGQKWTRKASGVRGWSSEDDRFDILENDGYCVLVAFDRDPVPGDTAEFWRRRFATVSTSTAPSSATSCARPTWT